MSKAPWSCDRPLDADRVQALLSSGFPDLAGKPVRYFDEGWDSQLFVVGADLLFRFPKRAECERDLVGETALLPALARQLAPLRVPRFDYVGAAGPLFPYRFAGYAMLPGVQASTVAVEDMDVAQV